MLQQLRVWAGLPQLHSTARHCQHLRVLLAVPLLAVPLLAVPLQAVLVALQLVQLRLLLLLQIALQLLAQLRHEVSDLAQLVVRLVPLAPPVPVPLVLLEPQLQRRQATAEASISVPPRAWCQRATPARGARSSA